MEKNKYISKFVEFCTKYNEQVIIFGLAIIFYFIFFHGIGTYPLMDVDETRYVTMSRDMFNTKDFLTLFLNGEYFFEKPPLYFWQECLSFGLFGKINEFSARFPVSLLGFVFSFLTYFTSKKIVDKKFGVVTSLVLATSLEFVILSKYAILDIVLTFYIWLALLSYFQTFFCKDYNKKYFWWLFYLFSGLAVMAKGIPGAAIPFGTVFFASIISKRFRENFKPLYLIPGMIIFLVTVLPWHLIMLKKYDPLFFNEYIIKHHLHRFLNTENNEIGRKQPFYYYFLTILWGTIPWIFSVIAVLISKIKNLKNIDFKQVIKSFNFDNLDNLQKYIVLSWIAIIWIIVFYSSSSTKLATYILPVYFPMAIVIGLMWQNFIYANKNEKPIKISALVVGWLFVAVGIVAMFSSMFLPKLLVEDISCVKLATIFWVLAFGISSVLCIKCKKYVGLFITYVVFITAISAFLTGEFYKVDYKFGQQDLIEFAQYAKENHYSISANGMSRKYSLLFYSDTKVDYNKEEDNLKDIIEDLNKKNNLVIIKNKKMDVIKDKYDYETVKVGRKYTMIKGK